MVKLLKSILFFFILVTCLECLSQQPAATFTSEYKKKYKDRILIEVPPLYELMNIVIAFSEAGNDTNLVYKHTEYYSRMRSWFSKFSNHPIFDSLRIHRGNYTSIKMHAYAFEFRGKKIVRSKIYDRTGFTRQTENFLIPFVDLLQSYADQSNFLRFYKKNLSFYRNQTRFFTDTINIKQIDAWLRSRFNQSGYNAYKLIFSPLVAYSQSATWFENNGFRELHAHINFPYPRNIFRYCACNEVSSKSQELIRSWILFTEINHGYINPVAEKYSAEIDQVLKNKTWASPSTSTNYPGILMFNEYMNWGLVSLKLMDEAPVNERETLVNGVVNFMVNTRGFTKFEKFNQELIVIYLNRTSGQKIDDLYPKIISWFEKQ
jgi:hypothetical protein